MKPMSIRQACRVFGLKGPVNTPSFQADAHRAKAVIWPYLSEEEKIQLNAAMAGQSRAEFDGVWKVIYRRLLLGAI